MARFDEEKTLKAIIYLARKTGRGMDLYMLVKLLYFADKKHLHTWGRTITGDKYARMKWGPVPSAAYDMIKSVRGNMDWERELSSYFRVEGNDVVPSSELVLEMDEFAESEIEALDTVFTENCDKDFEQLRNKAHDEAWTSAKSHWMEDEDLAEGDTDLVAYIRQLADDERHFETW